MAGCAVEVVAPLPAHSFGPDIDSLAFEGELAYAAPCLFLDTGGMTLNILWPTGYSLRGEPPAVIRYDGTEIARVGDSVRIGGLSTPNQVAPAGCPLRHGILLGVISSVNGSAVEPPETPKPPPQPRPTERPKPR